MEAHQSLIEELNQISYYGERIGLRIENGWFILGKPIGGRRSKKYNLSLAINNHWHSVSNNRYNVKGITIYDAVISGRRNLEEVQWFYDLGFTVELYDCDIDLNLLKDNFKSKTGYLNHTGQLHVFK